MPVVSVLKSELLAAIGEEYGCLHKFEDLMFEFGTEYDGVDDSEGPEKWRIEVPANRYDLLSLEGITLALRVFLGKQRIPSFKIKPVKPVLELVVEASVNGVRPYCVAAALRGVSFTKESYDSFIDFQDKLHMNLGRKRSLVSMGTHDLCNVQPPFRFCASKPENIQFRALYQNHSLNGRELFTALEGHQQLRQYLPLLKDEELWPVIKDAKNAVCSLPPIINGEQSKISLSTRDVFIEVTGKDRTKVHMALNALVCSFSKYCSELFHIEPVKVRYEGDRSAESEVTPSLTHPKFTTSTEYVRRLIGLPTEVNDEEVVAYLDRMMLPAKVTNGILHVEPPALRSDILHACDIAEDVAIAYGFNNLPKKEFPAATEQKLLVLLQRSRSIISRLGFNEVLNFGLCSHSDNYEKFGNKEYSMASESRWAYQPYVTPVDLKDSKTNEFQFVRTSLCGGLMKTLMSNKHNPMPIKMFEVGQTVAHVAGLGETNSQNRAMVAMLVSGVDSHGFEALHGALDSLLMDIGLDPIYKQFLDRVRAVERPWVYGFQDGSDAAFCEGRNLQLVIWKRVSPQERFVIGRAGVLKPSVLKNFEINTPTSLVEFTLEPLLEFLPDIDLIVE